MTTPPTTQPARTLAAEIDVLHPDTGLIETVSATDLPAVVVVLTEARDEITEWVRRKSWAEESLRRIADERRAWGAAAGLVVGSTRVVVEAPDASTPEWNHQVLEELRDHLTTDRFVELCRPEYVLNPQTSQLHGIAKHAAPGDPVREIIERAETRKPKPSRAVKLVRP